MADQRSDELPPLDIRRWLARQKSQVVAAVRSGRLTLDEVSERYGVSPEEFRAWNRTIEEHGVSGLKLSRIQYRRGTHRRSADVIGRP